MSSNIDLKHLSNIHPLLLRKPLPQISRNPSSPNPILLISLIDSHKLTTLFHFDTITTMTTLNHLTRVCYLGNLPSNNNKWALMALAEEIFSHQHLHLRPLLYQNQKSNNIRQIRVDRSYYHFPGRRGRMQLWCLLPSTRLRDCSISICM